MGEGTKLLRLRAVLATSIAVLAVVAVLVAVAGGWATYTAHVDPGTVETNSEATAFAIDGSFDHSAEVTRANPVFQTGSTLTNRSRYFMAASPVLDGSFRARFRGTEPAEIQLDVVLVHKAVGEDTVYWTDRIDLASTTETTVSPGDAGTVEFSFNASEAKERRDNITAALGNTHGELETHVVVDVTATSMSNGEETQVDYTARLPVSFSSGGYSIGSATGTSEKVTYMTAESVPRDRGPLLSYGGPIGLLIGLGGLAGLVAVYRRDEPLALTPEEREILDYRDQRAEFDEWVVRAELPESVLERETSTAASFADLVDFAIDANGSVIEEPTRNQYFAVTPDLLVTYRPPEPIEESA